MRNEVFKGKIFTWLLAKKSGFLHKKVTKFSLGPQDSCAWRLNHALGACERSFSGAWCLEPFARRMSVVFSCSRRQEMGPRRLWMQSGCWKCMFVRFFGCLLLCKMSTNLEQNSSHCNASGSLLNSHSSSS